MKYLIFAISLFFLSGCYIPNTGYQQYNYQNRYSSSSSFSGGLADGLKQSNYQTKGYIYEGSKIIADDGQYLGKITSNKFDADSIFNNYGSYGGKYSANSIFNNYGTYGGKYSNLSPFNPYTTTPPKIITSDNKWAYLTTNTSLTPSVSPFVIINLMQ